MFHGWSLDSTVNRLSGQPVGLTAGTTVLADGRQVKVRPDVVPGVPFWVKDSTAPGGQRINYNAFTPPPLLDPTNPSGYFARQGTLGRNVVRLPGLLQVNMALRRQFRLTERLNFQLKAEVFNIFNHPLFGNYLTDLGFGPQDFGKATSTLNQSLGGLSPLYQLGGPRSVQLSARISF
jgi:hypothetical protein